MSRRGGFETAAQRRAVQCCDERDVAARHFLEISVPVEREWQPRRSSGLPVLRRPPQIETGAKIVAMTEDDAAFRFRTGAFDGFAQLLHHGRIEAVALVRAVEADQRDLAVQFISDRLLFAHTKSPGATSSNRRLRYSGAAALLHFRTTTIAASPA